jgi:hypothetical protein
MTPHFDRAWDFRNSPLGPTAKGADSLAISRIHELRKMSIAISDLHEA